MAKSLQLLFSATNRMNYKLLSGPEETGRSRWNTFIAEHKDKTLGGSFCPIISTKGIYTFYYCGIRDYHKKIFPTHLAVVAAIEYAVENNIPMVDFMGAGKPNDQYGVRDYKAQFGGELVKHGRYIKVLNPLLFRLGKFGLKLIAKIK